MAIKLTYHWEGDYLIPDLTPPPEPKIGVWGRRRKRYLQQHREPIYTGMLNGIDQELLCARLDMIAQTRS